MRTLALLLMSTALLGACARSVAHAQGPAQSVDEGCSQAPAAAPPGLVLGLARHIVPHGRNAIDETAELTTGASCAPGIAECSRVSSATLATLYASLRVRLRHDPPGVSPHYGARTLYARWATGRCALSDSVQAPLSQSDRASFDTAFDSVLGAIVSARTALHP